MNLLIRIGTMENSAQKLGHALVFSSTLSCMKSIGGVPNIDQKV